VVPHVVEPRHRHEELLHRVSCSRDPAGSVLVFALRGVWWNARR
jgi:hypothetical protein